MKAYKPEASSVGSGQVLECPYDFVRTRVVVREMADQLALSLVESRLVTVSYTHLDVYKRQLLSQGTIMTVPWEEAPANYVPAAAVIRRRVPGK